VPVGTALARLDPLPAESAASRPGAAPSAPPTAAAPPEGPRPRSRPPAPRRAARPRVHPAEPGERKAARPHVRSSPLARRRAAAVGIDLTSLTGTGPDGAVVAADVDRAGHPGEQRPAAGPAVPRPTPEPARAVAPEPVTAAAQATADRQEALRRATARLMARSKREIPHYYVGTAVDLSAAQTWLRATNERRSITDRLLPGVLLLKAAALAAAQVPELNGFWDDGFRAAPAVHLGVAVSLRGGGLVAPAIHDADRLSLDHLMDALRDLVGRARAGRLRSSEMADPTITVTNLGDQGVDEVHGVIYPPQVALVGFGKIAERPWAAGGMLGVRPTVGATLAADHRASDGLVGARFLATLDRLLQTPEEL
jgi:pyruvate dehydrogenase E2 component (dihydrolipoamide acetyltransferase)